MSAREIQHLIDMFGSVAVALKSATHDEHHRIYTACRLTCEYDPENRTIRASIIDPTEVRGGLSVSEGGLAQIGHASPSFS